MLIVGLTGGIATGKSTVSCELNLVHGIPVVDADLLAREVVRPGTGGYRAILRHFSDVEDLVADNGELNRAALGRSVFGNKERLAVLNSIQQSEKQSFGDFSRHIFLENPWLFLMFPSFSKQDCTRFAARRSL